jgi:hypothetical protein
METFFTFVISTLKLGAKRLRRFRSPTMEAIPTGTTREHEKEEAMTMTTEQLAALKGVAEKATPGPWKAQRNARLEIISSVEPFEGCGWGQAVAHVYRAGKMNGTPYRMPAQANADFIATFDPATCLELLEEVERLTEHLANVEHDFNASIKR